MDVTNDTGDVQLTEHEQNMVDYVDNKEALSKGLANPDNATEYVEPTTDDTKEDANSDTFVLPEKFKSVEDLLESYTKLEQKLHTEPEATGTSATTDTPDVTTDNSDNVSIDTYMQEIIETGQLSEDSKKALNDSGVSDAVINSMIEGQNAITEQIKTDVYNSVGGEEAYNGILQWASENLSDGEIDAFNTQITSGNIESTKFALKSLQAMQGTPPTKYSRQIQGDGTAPSASKGYESKTEMYQAMRHPAYGKDPSYTRMVENKIGNSKF